MNRAERRRAQRHVFGTLELIDPDRLPAMVAADGAFAMSLLEWVSAIPSLRPLCATCDAEFHHGSMPRLFHRVNGRATLSGSCSDCVARFPTDAAMMRAIVDAYGRARDAQLRVADPASFHARGGRA